ncbi:MAG: mechanosensitive ion channel domain-containing protein, partial [Chromatiaceae bacterium]
TTDSFGYTVRVLGLTPLLALPLPLVLAAMSWALLHDPAGTEMTRGLGDTLARVTAMTLTVTLLVAICVPKGLAAAHFRWPEQNLGLLRAESRRLLWIAVPAALLVHLTDDLYPAQSGGTLARLTAPIAFSAITWFLYRVFHPRRGVLTALRRPGDYPLVMRGYWLWYPVLVLYPLLLAVLALSGYLYTVRIESYNFLASLRLLLALVVLNALALRWLLVVRRRLAYEAALERRKAAQAELLPESDAETAELQFDEPEVDLSALSDDTSGLIRFSIGLAAVVGVLLIWSDTLPALRVLDDQVLWHATVLVDGEEQRRPITLVDLGLAALYAAGTWVLLRRLPAFLEIVLLRRSHMGAADRYAATTLTTYVIAAVGLLLVLGSLGASWSQLQWMAAALSVGIGFGLQEIVANFISGLIILFERPIRVGDTVTVGDTDGVVTRIRIRATTIRNFDRKELLVPNKEFITGRLLNWSLSDPITRVVVVVGVAYGSDVDEALAIMKRIAEAHEHVVDDPPPFVTFDTFGDNALVLTLRAYVDSVDVRMSTITALNRAINRELAAAGIPIAFPQRDVHLDTSAPLRIQIEDRRGVDPRAPGESDQP